MEPNKKPHNPSAFPSKLIDHQESAMQSRTVYNGQEDGMTLRDYFANTAMQGELSHYMVMAKHNQWQIQYELIAEQSYKMADAMLKQREL